MRYCSGFPLVSLLVAALILGCSTAEPPEPASTPSNVVREQARPTAAPVETAEIAGPAAKAESPAGTGQEAPESAARQWKDPDGNVLAVGDFVSVVDGKVGVQKPDGLGAVVPLDRLCQADREFALSQSGADLPPEQEPEQEAEEVAAQETVAEIAAMSPAGRDGDYQHQKVVIPFDFVSEFDDGRYGRKIGEMLVAKIRKQGKFAVPDAIDIRDLCNQYDVEIKPDTPLPEIRRVLRDLFDAHIAIWGSCERVPGHDWDVYDLTIKCADFSETLEPKMLYEKVGVRTKTVSEIPHLYVAEMLDELYGREPGGPPPVNQLAERNWRENPNLIENGGFEAGNGGVPYGWEARGGQQREPLGNLVRWTSEAGNPNNRVIRFTFDKSVGDGFGVMYYSEPFPIEEGATYRSRLRYRSNGPKVIVFIKCYDEMGSEYKPRDPAGRARHPMSQAGGTEYVPEFGQLRECYRSQQNMKGPKNQWNTRTEDFTPKHTKYSPKWGRVMLYSYLGAGVVEFDDVVVKQILPASASDRKEQPRHSMESSVTIEEMKENERRAREARQE